MAKFPTAGKPSPRFITRALAVAIPVAILTAIAGPFAKGIVPNSGSVIAGTDASIRMTGSPAIAIQQVEVNFSDVANAEKKNPRARAAIAFHRPLRRPHGAPQPPAGDEASSPPAKTRGHRVPGASFPGTTDNGTMIPPDTMGAIGPNHIVE